MIRQFLAGGGVALLLSLGACSTSDESDDDSTAVDLGDYVGLWDASTGLYGGDLDERYVEISADGDFTEYDYRQDAVANDGNCHVVTELSLEAIGRRPMSEGIEEGEGGVTDRDDIEITAVVPVFRLTNNRTVSFYRLDTGAGVDGSPTDESPSTLFVRFDDRPLESWASVSGRSSTDFARCGET